MAEPDPGQHIKIFFDLTPDEDGYPPVATESMWAVPLGGGRYRIDNIPFFVRGIALSDTVSAISREDGTLGYGTLVQPSGHSTLRVLVHGESHVADVRAMLRQAGCSTEQSHIPGLIAVDIPPLVPLEEVRRLLASGVADERWEYEEGCLGTEPA